MFHQDFNSSLQVEQSFLKKRNLDNHFQRFAKTSTEALWNGKRISTFGPRPKVKIEAVELEEKPP